MQDFLMQWLTALHKRIAQHVHFMCSLDLDLTSLKPLILHESCRTIYRLRYLMRFVTSCCLMFTLTKIEAKRAFDVSIRNTIIKQTWLQTCFYRTSKILGNVNSEPKAKSMGLFRFDERHDSHGGWEWGLCLKIFKVASKPWGFERFIRCLTYKYIYIYDILPLTTYYNDIAHIIVETTLF